MFLTTTFCQASEPMSPGGNLADQFETSTGEQRFLRAFVVLEEFVKELAAVAQVRWLHGRSTSRGLC